MKDGLKFSHIGIPTKTNKPETYLPDCKLWVNDCGSEPYGIEWLYFEDGSPMPEVLQTKPHVAYFVDDMEKALAGEKVIVPPFKPADNLTCAFIEHEGIAVELMKLS